MAETDTKTRLGKVLNFRDVGSSINNLSDQHLIRPGLFFRSGIPDEATPEDRHQLINVCRIKTIIDLRTDSEHVEQTKKLAKNISSSPVAEPADPAGALRIPSVQYEYVNFNGHAYSSALIKQLSYWHRTKLAALYVFGYRNEAISVLGENVMAKRGLIGLAEDSLRHCTTEVKAVFDILSNKDRYPLLVHCTQGKDRTGLIVLLVLLLLRSPLDAVDKDYMLSAKELATEREERLVQIRKIGLPDEFAGCAEGWVRAIAAWIEDTYGGVAQYLEHCNVGLEQQRRVTAILRSES